MTDIEQFAATLREALIPTVAKRTPWAAMTADSQQTYVASASAALMRLVSLVAIVAKIEADKKLQDENAAMARFIDQQGFRIAQLEDGSFAVSAKEESREVSAPVAA